MKKRTILLARKTDRIANQIKKALVGSDFRVLQATSAQAARLALKSWVVDQALIDVRLRTSRTSRIAAGLQLARWVRTNEIPVKITLLAESITQDLTRKAFESKTGFALADDLQEIVTRHGSASAVSLKRILSSVRKMESQKPPKVMVVLSDIHMQTKSQAKQWLLQLESDLANELRIQKIDYVIVTGDLTHHSFANEYVAMHEFLSGLCKRFDFDTRKLIMIPGNHDVNWDLGWKAYRFVPQSQAPNTLPTDGTVIKLGEVGIFVRDDIMYKQRFQFYGNFYKRIYKSKFPMDYEFQAIVRKFPSDRIVILGLNSAWMLDEHYKTRSNVNGEALATALDEVFSSRGKYKNWLKIAVVHHPVQGKDQIDNTDFMQQLVVHGFKVIICGHIHEALMDMYRYDDSRQMHIITCGTFGAATYQLVPGIPLQYNVLTLRPLAGTITISSRKREKPEGAWCADGRWGKKNPSPKRTLTIKDWRPLHGEEQ